MVVCAVRYEPVSTCNSLLYRDSLRTREVLDGAARIDSAGVHDSGRLPFGSALPLKGDIHCKARHVSKVPLEDRRTAASETQSQQYRPIRQPVTPPVPPAETPT